MAIFRRRKLQQMLYEVADRIASSKSTDFVNRLDSPDPDQALPAEYELGLIWAISRRAAIEVDRPAGRRNPDIYSPDLLPSGPILADVAAISDFSLSGEGPMRRTANIISNFCASLISGAANHLHYTFGEERGYRAVRGRSQFFRERRVSALAWRTSVRDRWSKSDDPSIRRHLHDLAALAPRVEESEMFEPLARKVLDDDAKRTKKPDAKGLSLARAMIPSLAADPLWRVEYERFVQAVSFGPDADRITFDQAMDACARLVPKVHAT